MFNWLHSRIHDPNRGWDPIDPEYAEEYGRNAVMDPPLLEYFGRTMGGFEGREIVDVGSGPGQYALEFARRGAKVTCLDVSRTYLDMARSRLVAAGFKANFVLGYVDHVARLAGHGFDGAFSNVSWYYCMSDRTFVRELLRAVRPGGIVLVRQTTDDYEPRHSFYRRLVYGAYRRLHVKIGHPHPARGLIAREFHRQGGCTVDADYAHPHVDLVTVRKHGSVAGNGPAGR